MGEYFQITAGVLLTVILGITLSRHNGDLAVALSILVCAMVIYVAAQYLEPVLSFLEELQAAAQMEDELFNTLLKVIGIGLIAQIAGLICADSGNGALGKGLQMLAVAVILCLSVPLMRQLLLLMERIMGEV